MLMELAAGGSVALMITVILTFRFGWPRTLQVLLLVALALVPFRLFGGSQSSHAGISGYSPQAFTYTALIFIIIVTIPAVVMRGKETLLPVMFISYLALGAFVFWGGTAPVWSGAIHLATGAAALMIGSYMGRPAADAIRDHRDEEKNLRVMSATIALIVAAQATAGVLQLMGVAIRGNLISSGRITGTMDHPGTLGKVLFLLLFLVLPLLRSSDRLTRRLSVFSLITITVLIGLTQGRANMVSVGAALLVWVILAPGSKIGSRLGMLLLIAAAALPFVGIYLARFDEDPDGGVRPELTAAALQQIAQNPWLGTGPNQYVQVVGRVDASTALGLPVHNALLLAVAELGVFVALLFFLPFLLFLIRSASNVVRRSRDRSPWAVAWVAMAPGLIVTAMTGYGLLATPSLALWCFVSAFAAARISSSPRLAGDARSAHLQPKRTFAR